MNAFQKLAVGALESCRSDDYERAKYNWAHLTPTEMQIEMQIEYGASGRTRAEVLAEYKRREIECDAAIAWVKAQPS